MADILTTTEGEGDAARFVTPAVKAALAQLEGNLSTFHRLFPDDTTVDNIYYPRKPRRDTTVGGNSGWTTGFWTGALWLAYDLTGDAQYRQIAETQVESFKERLRDRIDTDHHDLGFLYTLSCVAAHKLTGDEAAKETALKAADQLMTRFLPGAGVIQAWGSLDDPEQRGRTIIDCLMNLPLLYWATRESGDGRYHEAAHRHAQQAATYLVREDASTFHTYYFDAHTGAPRYGDTHQGYRDDSCWARGQAWGVYGFVLSYAYTRDPVFLETACWVADYFLAHLPKDLVAYWDLAFTDGSDEERDSSASAIAVCGLLELVRWLPEGEAERYERAAHDILASLSEGYAAPPESNALLLHGVYGKPNGSGIDEANLWGDYFYLEALTRLSRDWTLYW